ncbi:hypothetical protein LJR034_005930 [Caballeronia sp. LjRoot34]|uniref:hypothetical protein n=1 Tax=Caballeronia sp. LjRoot34 TaxID=3342325 RepID=UPI003ECF0D90
MKIQMPHQSLTTPLHWLHRAICRQVRSRVRLGSLALAQARVLKVAIALFVAITNAIGRT